MARNTSGLKRTAGPGRPPGARNKKTLAFEEFWRGQMESEDYRVNLWRRIQSGRASHMETYLAQKLFGRPEQTVQGDMTLRIFHEGLDDDA